jgi:hypothetical protein
MVHKPAELLLTNSVLPGPLAMSSNRQPLQFTSNSVLAPAGVVLPMLLVKVPPVSGSGFGVNTSAPATHQRFPSGPSVM